MDAIHIYHKPPIPEKAAFVPVTRCMIGRKALQEIPNDRSTSTKRTGRGWSYRLINKNRRYSDMLIPTYRRPAVVMLLFLSVLLAACGSNQNPLQVTVERCPAFAVVGGSGSLVRFQDEGRETGDVVLRASIANLKLDCDQGSDVISDISFNILAHRGPAMLEAEELALSYFIAVVRDNSLIVLKEIYDTRLHFEAGVETVNRQEILRQRLPEIEMARRYNYEILIGFQLSDEELRYNLLR